MSKVAIVYASTHHGNTKKLVDAIAGKYEIDVIDATTVKDADLATYDAIGFASGIYGANYHQAVTNFAKNNLPDGKKVFYIFTSAMPKDFTKSIANAIEGKNAEVLGCYGCRGFNTFGPFKLVGGTSKGHPDQTDLDGVISFYEGLGL